MNSLTALSMTTNEYDDEIGSTNFDIDFNESILQVNKPSSLYIIEGQTQYHIDHLEQFQKYCFLPLKFYDVNQIKTSCKKMAHACVPSMSTQTSNNNANSNETHFPSVTLPNSMLFYKLIEEL